MKTLSYLVGSLLLAATPLAYSKTVIYKGSLNGAPVTLQFDVTDSPMLAAQYIPCQTEEEIRCSGPGSYAYFDQNGSVALTYAGTIRSASLNLAFYIGEQSTQNGQLNGKYDFVDRTNLPNTEDDTGHLVGYQFSEEQYGGNPIVMSLSKSQVTALIFPDSYRLNWSLQNSQDPRGYDNGSVSLQKIQ